MRHNGIRYQTHHFLREQTMSENTNSKSRFASGGFTERFSVVRLDGRPTRADARYFILDYSGADPHAVEALTVYADRVASENPTLAADIREALKNPKCGPAQHPCADAKLD